MVKNTEVSITQGVFHTIYILFWIFFRSDTIVPGLIIVGYVQQISSRKAQPSVNSPKKAHLKLG